MFFSGLRAEGFRNLADIDIAFPEKFQCFLGENGSGKTSVLEALYYLSHAKSFRTSSLKQLIHHQADAFSLFSTFSGAAVPAKLGIRREQSGKQEMRFNGERLTGISTVTQQLPVQFLDTDAHRGLASSPSNRRRFLDWGVFHVEHSYATTWQTYQKVLKQRNAMLKAGAAGAELKPWTEQLIQLGVAMQAHRQAYMSDFLPVFEQVWQELMKHLPLPAIRFYPGWNGACFAEALMQAANQDKRYGYTTVGPHRADIAINAQAVSVFDFFSQGQQKALTYALKVAQGVFLQQKTGRSVVYLIDDLPAELDSIRLQAVFSVLEKHASQIFITAIEMEVDWLAQQSAVGVFQVQDGVLKKT
jgi:DNA replication and repair protein RecF